MLIIPLPPLALATPTTVYSVPAILILSPTTLFIPTPNKSSRVVEPKTATLAVLKTF